MRILAVSLQRPGNVLQPLTNWWRRQGHEVADVRVPFSYSKQLLGSWIPSGHWDFAISQEPVPVLHLLPYRWFGRIRRLVFWRVDYRPYKYLGLARWVDWACRKADEVWSIVPLDGPGVPPADRYLPALLEPEAFVSYPERRRSSTVLWMGPDQDGSYTLVEEAVRRLPHVILVRADWAQTCYAMPERELDLLLASSKVGIAIYDPNSEAKTHSEPARVKRFLAAGVPVVLTTVSPIWKEVVRWGAGAAVAYTPDAVERGIQTCLSDFEQMSAAAREMARVYEVSDAWFPAWLK